MANDNNKKYNQLDYTERTIIEHTLKTGSTITELPF